MTAEKGGTNGAAAAETPEIVFVNPQRMTISEIAAAEALAGVPITYVQDPEKPKGLIFQGIACVWKQRTDPGFTWDQAADVIVSLEENEPLPPTNGRASSTGSRSRSTSRSSRGKTSKA